MDMDRERNCYTYREFGHMVWHCRDRRVGNRIGEGRRLEYGSSRQRETKKRNEQSNLNEEEDLIVFNEILVKIGLQCLQE